VAPARFKDFSNIQNQLKICNFKIDAFPCSKNIQTLHDASFEYFEHLSRLGLLQIPNRIHAINFGTDSNLNLL
jgi:hypothetical protein